MFWSRIWLPVKYTFFLKTYLRYLLFFFGGKKNYKASTNYINQMTSRPLKAPCFCLIEVWFRNTDMHPAHERLFKPAGGGGYGIEK